MCRGITTSMTLSALRLSKSVRRFRRTNRLLVEPTLRQPPRSPAKLPGVPRRVAHVTPLYFDEQSYLGGGERYVMNLARALRQVAGDEWLVDIVSYGPAPQTLQLEYGILLRILPVARPPRHPLDAVSWGLPGAIRNVDIVHVHQPFTRSGETAVLAAKVYGKPVCLTDLGGVASRVGFSLGIVELADSIVAISEFSASLFQTTTPIDVIRGGVDDDFFAPPRRAPSRDRFLYVGRLLPHKGIDRLLTALPRGIPLTICGRPYHEEYYAVLRKLARGKDAEFILSADDSGLRELYRRAWAVVLPSVYVDFFGNPQVAPELMGLTLLEGAACGTPGICSRVGGAPEFIRDKRTGFIFKGVADLSAHLHRLAEDVDLVSRLGRAARQMVEDEYGLGAVGHQIADVYTRLCEPATVEA
jgi:alpha-maltose-1-phosphate synthase